MNDDDFYSERKYILVFEHHGMPGCGAEMSNTDIQILWMTRKQLPAILEIEESSFDNPWTEEDYLDCMRQRNVVGMFAENSSQVVVGAMIYELNKNSLHVLNFMVAPGHRHRGVGTAMIQKLVNKLIQQRRHEIILEVRESNLDAQLFFKRMGFKAEAILHGHYGDMAEDAYQMSYQLPQCDRWDR